MLEALSALLGSFGKGESATPKLPCLLYNLLLNAQRQCTGGVAVVTHRGQVHAVADVFEHHVEGVEAQDHALLVLLACNGAHVAAAGAPPVAATAGHGAVGGGPIPRVSSAPARLAPKLALQATKPLSPCSVIHCVCLFAAYTGDHHHIVAVRRCSVIDFSLIAWPDQPCLTLAELAEATIMCCQWIEAANVCKTNEGTWLQGS